MAISRSDNSTLGRWWWTVDRWTLAALLVLTGDALKGALPVIVARSVLGLPDWSIVLIGLAAILGHDFPIFLRGHGGKGIATSLGVITALAPPVGLVGVVFWWIIILSTRYASLASLTMLLVCSIAICADASVGHCACDRFFRSEALSQFFRH